MRILATTDVHGYPLPKTFGKADLLIDAGDFFIGSPLTTYYNTTMEISPLVGKANDLGYDVMVPGNHDLDHGLEFLLNQTQHLKASYLCANLLDLEDRLLFEPYKIFQRKGLKVAVIGLITSLLPTLLPYRVTKHFKCMSAEASLQKYLPKLKSSADLVIVVYHGGVERDLSTGAPTQYDTGEDEAYRLASCGVDGLICGHQHRVNAGKVGNCAVVQPGFRGKQIGELLFEGGKASAKVLPLDTAPTHDPDFENWLDSPVDVSHFDEYMATLTDAFPLMAFKGSTKRDFLASFIPPYGVLQYRLSEAELADVADLDADADGGVSIVTNLKTFPSYRLQKQFIHNIFDEYLHWLKTKKPEE